MNLKDAPFDHKIIYDIIEPSSRVLDLGCGEGDLLRILAEGKDAKVQGIELDEKSIYKCVEKGLSVYHGDIDSGLPEYPDNSFDYVILNESLQEVKKVEFVLREAMRIGRKVIVGVPNFAYIKARVDMFFKGRAPVTKSLPYRWYNSPNIHFLSLKDFRDYCGEKGIKISYARYFNRKKVIGVLPNLLATNGIFIIEGGYKS